MAKTYFLYHDPCADGLGAKYAAWHKFGDKAEYIGVNYDKPIPELESGADVIIADFSYSKEILRELNSRSKSLVVLDHHKTAEAQLAGEPYATFDMHRSGAVMAWQYLHPNTDVPEILLHIQDRDLWNWKLPFSKEILATLSIIPKDVSKWNPRVRDIDSMILDGKAISEYQDAMVHTLSKPGLARVMMYRGHKIALVNNNNMNSEVLSQLAKNPALGLDYALGYVIEPNGAVYLSFRSDKEGNNFDVSVIAGLLGGGGHRNASGARTNLAWLVAMYEGERLDV